MSAVDAPPGLDFAGPAAGEFRARARPRMLARVAFGICLLDGGITVAMAARNIYAPGTSLLFVGPLMCMSIAAVGLAVRSARVRVGRTGVRWGWAALGFQMPPERIVKVMIYDNAVAIEPKKGNVWFLSKHDWDHFEAFASAFSSSGLTLVRAKGRMPLRGKLQAYGLVLDGLLVVTLIASGLLLFFGAIR